MTNRRLCSTLLALLICLPLLAPGDVVWATRDLVAVCVNRPGPRTITLPRPATVTDLDRGTRLGDNLRFFQADFEERATRVFVLK